MKSGGPPSPVRSLSAPPPPLAAPLPLRDLCSLVSRPSLLLHHLASCRLASVSFAMNRTLLVVAVLAALLAVAFAQANLLPSGTFGPPLPEPGTPSKPSAQLAFKTPKFYPLPVPAPVNALDAQRLDVVVSLENFAAYPVRSAGSSSDASVLSLSVAATLIAALLALLF